MKAYIALIRIDLKLAMRNRAVLFFNWLFPLIFFFIFAQSSHAEQGGAITQIVAMVATIGVIGNGLFGAGMRAASERENNTLRRYKVTPIGPLPLLVASMATGLILYLPYIFLMLTLATNVYHMPVPKELPSMLIFICFGVVCFRSIGLIVASVVNSMQEGVILVQLLYFIMLFLSGATFPITEMPSWLQTITQFIPAAYLVSGLEGILLRGEGLFQHLTAVFALVVATIVATFVATKIFRWEKEEKIKSSAKLWVVAALLPFFILGSIQAVTKSNVENAKITERQTRRNRSRLLRNARIFTGDGRIVESGSVLIKAGKIEAIYEGGSPDAKTLDADPIEASGKTILPGLIDMHVHLVATGGMGQYVSDPTTQHHFLGALEAYLYSGITAVKSVGDPLDKMIEIKELANTGRRLASELFICGPLFTAEGGHGTEYFKYIPAQYREKALAQFARMPNTPEQAVKMVDDLKAQRVDGIKAVLEAGAAGANFNRLDTAILKAIADEAHKQGLPITVHTGDARDVADALKAGTDGIEHGSLREKLPDELFVEMAQKGVFYDPTLSVAEGIQDLRSGNTELLNRSLLQQVGPKELFTATLKYMQSGQKGFDFPIDLKIASDNLVRAWKAGVPLITGSDAGNPLVFHGPTTQREVQLWIAAGIPAPVALQAATANSAKFLGAGNRFGTVRKGMEATLLVVDGNPFQDAKALEAISYVFLKGERVDRSSLFDQD
jgi:imidazolonepropionase-like amidohydrolase/ABC-type multidrug transport system permease subunit